MEVRGATTLPYGSSILPALSAADPIPCACQALMWFVSAGGLFLLPWAPMLEIVAGLDGSWDAAHHVGDVAQLMRASLGVTSAQAAIATWATGAAFGALLVCDVSSEALPATIRWPASWRCDNIQCYDEMFSEPTRASLVRRPGNVYSNALYLYAAVLIPRTAAIEPRAHDSGRARFAHGDPARLHRRHTPRRLHARALARPDARHGARHGLRRWAPRSPDQKAGR